jgi:LacI family transcriptional regulator
LKDIARECGLAVSSVSNILNNNSTSFASEEVRKRVRDTAERLGYKKDYLSSSLRTRKTRSVGLILDKIDDHTRQDFLVPFVERFSEQGYEVALAEHRHDPARAILALEGFTERCKEGVVLFTDLLGRPDADQEPLAQAMEASKLRILGVGSRFRGRYPSVDIDRGGAVDRSLRHFLDQGKRRILVVYEYEWDMRPRFSYWQHPAITFWGGIHCGEDFISRMEAIGADGFAFDAVFFRTDKIAIPALEYFQVREISVPAELEVISFDNFPFSRHTRPALSSWDIGFGRLGRRSQELMAAWLQGTPPAANHFELFEPDFVARKSHRGGLS